MEEILELLKKYSAKKEALQLRMLFFEDGGGYVKDMVVTYFRFETPAELIEKLKAGIEE